MIVNVEKNKNFVSRKYFREVSWVISLYKKASTPLKMTV